MQKTFAFATLLLAGCAATSPAPLTATHPASPDAPEGTHIAQHTSLRENEITRKSRDLLSAAQREQDHWDKFGPVSGTPGEASKDAPEMKHEHP